jgi:hypothetical protein
VRLKCQDNWLYIAGSSLLTASTTTACWLTLAQPRISARYWDIAAGLLAHGRTEHQAPAFHQLVAALLLDGQQDHRTGLLQAHSEPVQWLYL